MSVKAHAKHLRSEDLQLSEDVLLDPGVRCGREGHHWNRRKLLAKHIHPFVILTKIMTPLTHTMRFINDKTCQELPLIQILQSRNQPVTCTDLLWSNIQKLDDWVFFWIIGGKYLQLLSQSYPLSDM